MEKKFKTFFTFREYGDCKAKNEEQPEHFDNDGNHEILIIRGTGKNCIPGLCEVCGSKIRASVPERTDPVSPISETENLTPNETNESNGKARKTL